MAKFHLVVSTSDNYMEGIKVFLRSFFYYHKGLPINVHLLCFKDVDKSQLEEFAGRVKFVDTVSDHKAKACKIERFNYAANLEGVVGVFDGDMFFLDSFWPYFQIAANTDLIICGLNGSVIQFTEGHSELFGEDIDGLYAWKAVTSVPTIMRIDLYGHIWQRIHDHIMVNYTIGDFMMLNLLLAYNDLLDKVIALPAQAVTNIHHFMLKPNTRAISKNGKIISEDGHKILSCHGKWWNKPYTDNLINTMERFAKGDKKIVSGAVASRDLLLNIFNSWKD